MIPNRNPIEPWTVGELYAILTHISRIVSTDYKFCFFIDGLDEYDGRPEDIIAIIQELSASPIIKVCVSTRRWNIFRDAFENCRGMIMENFTNADITNYIEAELSQSQEFMKSQKRDPRCSQIITEISKRAQGVFLWVFLVIRNLRRDMRSEESFRHLKRKVDELPKTLEEWLSRIFESIDPVYRQQTARILLLVLHLEEREEEPIPLVAYHCLELEETNPNYAVMGNIPSTLHTYPWEQVKAGLKDSQRLATIRLNDRCRDLIQPRINTSYPDDSVHHIHISLLHRTVRDFFRDSYLESLREKAGEYSPALSVSKIRLWLFKAYPIELLFALPNDSKLSTRIHHIENLLYQFWVHVAKHESEIDEQTVNEFITRTQELCDVKWTGLLVKDLDTRNMTLPPDLLPIAWAAYLGMASHVQRNWNLDTTRRIREFDVSPLLYALEPKDLCRHMHREIFIRMKDLANLKGIQRLDSTIVQVLLETGCDPNEKNIGLAFLYHFTQVHEKFNYGGHQRLPEDPRKPPEVNFGTGLMMLFYCSVDNVFQVAKLLIQHGLEIPRRGRQIHRYNFMELLGPLFGYDGVKELWDIHQEVQARRSWSSKISRIFGFH